MGTGALTCGSMTLQIAKPAFYYDFDASSGFNFLNTTTNTYDLSFVSGIGTTSSFSRISGSAAIGTYSLKQTTSVAIGTSTTSPPNTTSYYTVPFTNLGSGFTLSFWVKPVSDSNSRIAFVIANSTNTELFVISVIGNSSGTLLSLNAVATNSASNLSYSMNYNNYTIVSNTWHHVLVSVSMAQSSTLIEAYIDGTKQVLSSSVGVTFQGSSSTNNPSSNSGTQITINSKLFTGGNYNLYLGGVPSTIYSTGGYYNFTGELDGVYLFLSPTSSATLISNLISKQSPTSQFTIDSTGINAGTGTLTCGSLYVSGGAASFLRNGSYTYMNSNTVGYGNDSASYLLYCSGRIGCAGEINVWSDKRIKKDVKVIDPSTCLSLIDSITPKTFSYIDFLKNQQPISVGFIAQDIFEAFPEATLKNVDIIPNIYSIGILLEPDIIEFENKKISDFELSDCSSIKLKVFVNNAEQIVYVKEIVNETTFRITPPITCEITDNSFNKIFIYGQEVNDLLSIEKNAIFTMAVGAIKQLNTEIKTLKDEMKELKELVYQLTNRR